MRSHNRLLIMLLGGIGLAGACTPDQPPRSVNQFVEHPLMLEAAMVRCAEDRQQTRYDAECVNARQAVSMIEAKEEALRRAEFEARSDAKRQALRRAQAAAAEARRRTTESARLQREAEYLAQFGAVPAPDAPPPDNANIPGNTPQAVIPENDNRSESTTQNFSAAPATDGGNAPASSAQPSVEPPQTDLATIREELQRRNEDGGDPP